MHSYYYKHTHTCTTTSLFMALARTNIATLLWHTFSISSLLRVDTRLLCIMSQCDVNYNNTMTRKLSQYGQTKLFLVLFPVSWCGMCLFLIFYCYLVSICVEEYYKFNKVHHISILSIPSVIEVHTDLFPSFL